MELINTLNYGKYHLCTHYTRLMGVGLNYSCKSEYHD